MKKLLTNKELDLIKKHYDDLKLPKNFSKIFKKNEIKKIVYFMQKDKKNINKKISLILLKKIGVTTKPNSASFKSYEVLKYLKSYYN